MRRMRMYWAIYVKEFKSIRGIAAALVILLFAALVVTHGIIEPLIMLISDTAVGSVAQGTYPPYLNELIHAKMYLAWFLGSIGFMLPVILLYLFVHERLTRGTLLGRALPVRRSGAIMCRIGAVMTAGIPAALLQYVSRRHFSFITRPLYYWRLAHGYHPEVIARVTTWYNDHDPEGLTRYLERIDAHSSFPIRHILAGVFPEIKRTFGNPLLLPTVTDVLMVYLLLCAVVVASVGISQRFRAHRVSAGIVSAMVIIVMFVLLADPVFTEVSVQWYAAGELMPYFTIWTAILLAAGVALIERYEEG